MRSSRVAGRPLRRTLALTATIGILAISGSTVPAAAQSSTEPPEPDPSKVPQSGPLVEQQGFQQQQACMQASTGATIEAKPWSQLTLGFEQAHDQGYTGGNQKIAIVDTGVDTHPRLGNRVEDGGSNVPNGDGLTDCDGHGTLVAGIAAASESEQTGFVGVAPDARIMSLRQSSQVFQNQESGKTIGNTETMAQAVMHATRTGASVINISQSSCQPISRASSPSDTGNQQLQNAVKYAYENDVVVVAAAGNAGDGCQQNQPGSPSTAVLPAWFDDYVLTVASVNQQGAPSQFSVAGPWVDVAAPGEGLTSLDPGGSDGLVNQISTGQQGQMTPIQGTSFASPYVAGLAALIKEKHPGMKPEQVMDRIKETALHPGGDNGRNDNVGYGMINPMAALNDVVPAEHNVAQAPPGPTRLDSDVIPPTDWPTMLVAFGGALGGIGAIVFTAFLVNAVRAVRARQAGLSEHDQL